MDAVHALQLGEEGLAGGAAQAALQSAKGQKAPKLARQQTAHQPLFAHRQRNHRACTPQAPLLHLSI